MKYRTIIHGSFDQPEVFTGYDEFKQLVKIDKKLLCYRDGEDFLRFPFYCEVRRTINGEQVAHRCFMYSYDALQDANMEIDALECEIDELKNNVHQIKSFNQLNQMKQSIKEEKGTSDAYLRAHESIMMAVKLFEQDYLDREELSKIVLYAAENSKFLLSMNQ